MKKMKNEESAGMENKEPEMKKARMGNQESHGCSISQLTRLTPLITHSCSSHQNHIFIPPST